VNAGSLPTIRQNLIFLGRALSLGASVIFAFLAISQGPPVPPEGPGLERYIQYAFLVVGVAATALAWHTPAGGGALMLVTGVVLGVAAAMRYSEETALFVALLYVMPGTLFLMAWASHRHMIVQFATLAVVVGLMAYGGIEARARHERAFGPAHPESALRVQPFDRIEWVWSGSVTSRSARVNVGVVGNPENVRLLVDEGSSFSSPTATVVARHNVAGVASFDISNLEPSTRYFYAVEVDGQVDELRQGEFHTFPEGAASFTVAISSCARTDSNGAVFDAIRAASPLLYIAAGDLHYENIDTNSPSKFARAYQKVLTSPAQAALYQQTPIAYTWDDHDFGGNNSDGRSAARLAARAAYRTFVPHYDLHAGETNPAIYQSWSIGRVRFVMTDTRSERNRETREDGSRSLLGKDQLAWLKRELVEASRSHVLVIWVNAVPWVGDTADAWGGYADERREIANFIAEFGISNLLMLSGDAHMLAIDDGRNTDYSDRGNAGFPLLHAAALDRPGSIKGGPYSEGTFPGAGQFGLVHIDDNGGSLQVRLEGLNWEGQELTSYTFAVPANGSASILLPSSWR
jgi:hypothetical protein